MRMLDQEGSGEQTNGDQFNPLNANRSSRPMNSLQQEAQIRSIPQSQFPNMAFPQGDRAYTPLHPDNPSPSPFAVVTQTVSPAGGATPWHSPVSSTLSGSTHSSQQMNGGRNTSAPPSYGGNGRGASKTSITLGPNDPRWACKGNGTFNQTPNTTTSKNKGLSGSKWATPAAAVPAVVANAPASIVTTLAPAIANGVASSSNGDQRSISQSSTNGDSKKHRDLTSSIYATPAERVAGAAAAAACALTEDEMYAIQAENMNKAMRKLELSGLCQPHASLPAAPSDLRNNLPASAPKSHPRLTNQQIWASINNQAPNPYAATKANHQQKEGSYSVIATKSQTPAATTTSRPRQLSPAAKPFSPRSSTSSLTQQPTRQQLPAQAQSTISQTPNVPTPQSETHDIKSSIYGSSAPRQRSYMTTPSAGERFTNRRPTPSYLQRSLEPVVPSRRSTPSAKSASSRSSTIGNRPDTTDVVARRMIGKALGVNMPGKENAYSVAIDSALKENSKGNKVRWEVIKKDLKKDEGVKNVMAKVNKKMEITAADDTKENTKKVDEKKPKKNWDALLGAWKARQTLHAKNKVEKEKSSVVGAGEKEARKEVVDKSVKGNKYMEDFYAMMKSRSGKK